MLLGAEIQKPDWVHIAEKLGFQLHSQTTSKAFFEGWCTFAQNVAPSWENLARALEKMKVNKAKVAKIREKTGMEHLNDRYNTCKDVLSNIVTETTSHKSNIVLSQYCVNSSFLFCSGI